MLHNQMSHPFNHDADNYKSHVLANGASLKNDADYDYHDKSDDDESDDDYAISDNRFANRRLIARRVNDNDHDADNYKSHVLANPASLKKAADYDYHDLANPASLKKAADYDYHNKSHEDESDDDHAISDNRFTNHRSITCQVNNNDHDADNYKSHGLAIRASLKKDADYDYHNKRDDDESCEDDTTSDNGDTATKMTMMHTSTTAILLGILHPLRTTQTMITMLVDPLPIAHPLPTINPLLIADPSRIMAHPSKSMWTMAIVHPSTLTHARQMSMHNMTTVTTTFQTDADTMPTPSPMANPFIPMQTMPLVTTVMMIVMTMMFQTNRKAISLPMAEQAIMTQRIFLKTVMSTTLVTQMMTLINLCTRMQAMIPGRMNKTMHQTDLEEMCMDKSIMDEKKSPASN